MDEECKDFGDKRLTKIRSVLKEYGEDFCKSFSPKDLRYSPFSNTNSGIMEVSDNDNKKERMARINNKMNALVKDIIASV